MRRFAVLGVLLAPALATAEITVQRSVGADFEHFGESYSITDDQDTVTVIDDYATLFGLTVRSPLRSPSRFRIDADIHLGKETRRYRLDFEGRLERGPSAFELMHDVSWRSFREDGSYSISSDRLTEDAYLSWERELSDRLVLRLQDRFQGTWYSSPNQYNLNQWTNEPGVEARMRFRDLDEASARVRYARRSVPDSSALSYHRGTLETGLSMLFGWTSSLDIHEQLERRVFRGLSAGDALSAAAGDSLFTRENSWESRLDARFEFGLGDRATARLVHENEIIRYDHPDDFDFDSDWARTGFQVEVHRTSSIDLSIMPVYSFLQSATSAEEEYTETGLEAGVEIRLGTHTWISLTDEVGRRDYEITDPAAFTTGTSDSDSLLAELEALDTAFSDYIYNRLTLLVTSDVSQGVAVNLFVNWQPEDHHVNRHDTDTRIIAGGVEYRF